MNLQYISDGIGKTTGVFIPIEEWNVLKSKYEGIEQEEINKEYVAKVSKIKDFKTFLLKAPIFTKQQLKRITEARNSINKWRIKLS